MEQRLSTLKVEDLRTTNAAMTRCISLAKLAAKSEVPIVLLGETGTGKTLLAQAIHNSSARVEGPFISFNASAMSDTLLESQLFGHEKFREDLYHRLNGLTILIPALRDRREELPGLIANELKVSARRFDKNITAIHPAAMDRLLMHEWRGNLRELSHTVRTMTLFW